MKLLLKSVSVSVRIVDFVCMCCVSTFKWKQFSKQCAWAFHSFFLGSQMMMQGCGACLLPSLNKSTPVTGKKKEKLAFSNDLDS